MREFRGSLEGKGLRISVLCSRFNPEFSDLLLLGALTELRSLGVGEDDIEVISLPGALELPAVAARRIAGGAPDALVALGAVIRGETTHYDIVAGECARGLAELSRATGVPIAFGVLTTENDEQALARAHPQRQNKGGEAARVAVEMARLHRELSTAGGQ
jgi:6,7-dimethyl-8-ribityllumazine synthase